MRQISTLSEFREILESNKYVAVDFTATWCGPCRRIGPIFERLAQDHASVAFVKVDVDENEETSALYGVRAMPTFMFFFDGEKIDEVVGADAAKLQSKIAMLSAQADAARAEAKRREEDPFEKPTLQ